MSSKVVFCWLCISKSRSITTSPVAWSRLPVGSSASSSLGFGAKARARATRCCSPPESWPGKWVRRWPRPTAFSAAVAMAIALGLLASSNGTATFSSAVMVGMRWKDWNTIPIRSRRRRASRSSSSRVSSISPRRTEPDVACSSPASTISREVLPDPEGPTMPIASPAPMSRSIPRRMLTGPAAECRVRCRSRTAT